MARTTEQIIADMLGQKDIKIAQMAAQIDALHEQLKAERDKREEQPRLALVPTEHAG